MTMPVRSSVHAYERTRMFPIYYPAPSEDDPMATYTCTPDVTVGRWVRLVADEGGTVVIATAAEDHAVLGIVVAKPASNKANVQILGVTSGLLSDLVPGTTYFLGLGGSLVAAPLLPETAPYVQRVGLALAPDALYITLTGPTVRRAGV